MNSLPNRHPSLVQWQMRSPRGARHRSADDMGALNILNQLEQPEEETCILVLGLENSGKSTFLANLSDKPSHITSTEGFDVESLVHGNFKLRAWDVGGQKTTPSECGVYRGEAGAIIFLIDLDNLRIKETRRELRRLMKDDKLPVQPFLIFAFGNKENLPYEELVDFNAAIDMVREETWRSVQYCEASAKTGEGLQDGMQWLASQIHEAL